MRKGYFFIDTVAGYCVYYFKIYIDIRSTTCLLFANLKLKLFFQGVTSQTLATGRVETARHDQRNRDCSLERNMP